MPKFIVYIGKDEVLICRKKHENKMLAEWLFRGHVISTAEHYSREPDDYDRQEIEGVAVRIESSLHAD